jgi:hypothetical protein
MASKSVLYSATTGVVENAQRRVEIREPIQHCSKVGSNGSRSIRVTALAFDLWLCVTDGNHEVQQAELLPL